MVSFSISMFSTLVSGDLKGICATVYKLHSVKSQSLSVYSSFRVNELVSTMKRINPKTRVNT